MSAELPPWAIATAKDLARASQTPLPADICPKDRYGQHKLAKHLRRDGTRVCFRCRARIPA